MAVPKKVVWECKPHTTAKHRILREYLEQWLPTLLLGGFKGVTYAEAFAGSGIYKGGEPGSPVIAIQTFLKHQTVLSLGKPVDMLLIEENPKRLARLREEVAKARSFKPLPPSLREPRFEQGDHADLLLPALREMGALKNPVFAFLDSWGGPDIPLETARTIAALPAGEVFVTFGTNFLIRFGEDPKYQAEGDRAFGSQDWRKVLSLPKHKKKAFLVSAYRKSLQDAGFTHVTSFELLDAHGSDLHLVHGTKHKAGLEKMKNAMWSVDPVRGISFRDPRDPDQEAMFELSSEFNDHGSLKRVLLAQLKTGPRTFGQLKQHTLLETVFRPQHTRPALKDLIAEGEVENTTRGQLSEASLLKIPEHVQDAIF